MGLGKVGWAESRGGQFGEVTRQSTVNKGMVGIQIYVIAFSLDEDFRTFRVILLFLVQRCRHPYKRSFPL